MEYKLPNRILIASVSFALAAAAHAAATGLGPTYPSKPIRILTSSPGGGGDFVTRLMLPGLAAGLGQQVVVDNRNGTIGTEIVAKALPDGYTLILHGSTIWLTPFLRDRASYDPIRDFAPVIMATRSPNLLVVNPSVPVQSIKDLIALAKGKPGELNYGSISTGSSNHLAAELFKSMAGVNIVRVSYKTTATATSDLISGQVQLMFATTGAATPHVKSARLRALAITSAEPSLLLPGLPTIAASGLPDYEASSIFGLFTPASTPAAVVTMLNRASRDALLQSEVKDKFFNAGVEAVGSTPQQLAATVKSEMVRMGKVIKDAGIREE